MTTQEQIAASLGWRCHGCGKLVVLPVAYHGWIWHYECVKNLKK